jgi:hypothetical protein
VGIMRELALQCGPTSGTPLKVLKSLVLKQIAAARSPGQKLDPWLPPAPKWLTCRQTHYTRAA